MASYAETITKRQEYELLRSQLDIVKQSFFGTWRDCADFTKPRRMRAFVSDKNKGDRRNQKIIDSIAPLSLQTLVSGMHSGMTNPSTDWFSLGLFDPDLEKYGPVKEWLHQVSDILLGFLLKSNIYEALPTLYMDEAVFATGCMGLLEDRDLFRCYPYPIGTYMLGVSERGIVDTFVREYQMTVRQLVKEFAVLPGSTNIDWSKLSRTVKTLWDNKDYEANVDVCWIVQPNVDADPDKIDARYLPWSSCYFEKGQDSENVFLKESGFNEFPIIAPRWSVVAEEIYGTECPILNCLGDIKGLQIMTKRKAQAVEKGVNPPVQGPASLRANKVSLLPGDFTGVDSIGQDKGIRAIHEIRLDIDHMRVDIADVRAIIERHCFVDVFRMVSGADGYPKTATEIRELREEKLIQLSPIVERNNGECHKNVIDRVYAMADRAGHLPPPPEELQGQDLKVTYLSPLSRALKLIGVGSMDAYVSRATAIFQLAPETKHKTDWAEVLDRYGDMYGVPAKIIVDDDDYAEAVQQEQQQIQQAQQAEVAAQQAKATRDMGQADLSKDTALSRLVESAQQ